MGIRSIDRVHLPADFASILEGPVAEPGFQTVAEEEGRVAGVTVWSIGVKVRRRLSIHLYRLDGVLDFDAVRRGDTFLPDQVGAGGLEGEVEVGVICPGRQKISVRLIIDRRGLRPSEGRDC